MTKRKLTEKELYSHCFADLQRSAVAFFQHPLGKTHQIFLAHALKVLKTLKTHKAKKIAIKISELIKKTSTPPRGQIEKSKLADKILTYGSLVRP